MSDMNDDTDLSASIDIGNAITVRADQITGSGEIATVPVTSILHDSHELDGQQDITVIARYPYQMDKCQASLIEWAKRKIAVVKTEAADMEENFNIAKKSKWGSAALHRAWQRSLKSVDFYTKILAALEAGHCIVPNFPVDIIAVRTKKRWPKPMRSREHDDKTQESEVLPLGEGSFKNATPKTGVEKFVNSSDKSFHHWEYFASEWDDFDFPFTLAKPEIMQATARAMMDKVFDEIGMLPGKKKNEPSKPVPVQEDPIVVGRIIDAGTRKGKKKIVSFLIAWFVDTRTI